MYYLRTGLFKTKSSSVLKLHFCCCFLLDSNARVACFDLRLGLLLLNKPEKVQGSLNSKGFFPYLSAIFRFSLLQLKAR